MIADLQPYPQYKESGLPWVGPMPSHWGQRRMKFLFAERKQKGFPEEPLLAATQTKGVVRKEDFGTRTVTATKDFHLLKLVESGDFVISLRSFQGGIEISHCRGIISPAYTVLRPMTDAQSAYYSRFFKSHDFIASLTLFVTGIREGQNIDYVRLSRAYMPLPPAEDQEAIGRFLDWANGRIERTIRAKKRVIALLNEQKRAIIERAVSVGLDHTVPTKPSGVPWLNEIPAHWETRPLKQILSRMDYGTSENVRTEGSIRVLTMTHIRDGKVVLPMKGGLATIPPGLLLENHDLLFNRTNSPELVGKVGIFAGDARDQVTFASYLVRLRVRKEHNPIWLNYLLNSSRFWSFARSQALVSLHQANLNPNRYGRMPLPIPPSRAEQDKIVAHISAKAEEIERTESRLQREVELLREHRIRLIADVVTGKLDVRQAAAALPDQDLRADNVVEEDLSEADEVVEEFAEEGLDN